MRSFGCYLVCNKNINAVRDFLKKFFKEQKDGYTFEGWVSFKLPKTSYLINLMKDEEQPITQHMTFEIYCDSFKDLGHYAKKHGTKIDSFVLTSTSKKYRYHYIEIPGPKNICKVEVSYVEDM